MNMDLVQLIRNQREEGITFNRHLEPGNHLTGADLTGANLSRANLIDADLIGANLSRADLSGANLIDANLRGANLIGANLRGANLRGANLRGANLRGANLSRADLSGANLSGANLSGADLAGADLTGADLTGADLSNAYLRGANLSRANLIDANLSRATGLLSAVDYIEENFEFDTGGNLIVYKTFSHHYTAPDTWAIEPGAVITETCNPCRVSDCASGVNVAKRDYKSFGSGDLWKCIIKPQWISGVVVPYHTDGKMRCEKLQLVEIVNKVQS